MSCGGKLEELPEKAVLNEEIVVLEEVTVLDDPVPEPVIEEAAEKESAEDLIEINLKLEGFEPEMLEMTGNNTQISQPVSEPEPEFKPEPKSRPKPEPKEKKQEPKKNDIDFDSLFTELNTIEPKIVSSDDSSGAKAGAEMVDDESEDMPIKLKSEKILVKTASEYHLKPAKIADTYDVSVDELIKEVITGEFEESCLPMLRRIEENLRNSRGGVFYLRGDAGSGKSHFVNRIKTVSEKSNGEGSFSLVVTDANIFDFDFMIFISLARVLMKIKSNDVGTVRKKLDKLFGDTLPDSKKDCLSALICLNFVPVKTKLPKHDIEYLLSYVLYGLSRSKPVIWVVNNANTLNVRSIKFFNSLQKVFEAAPLAVILIADPDAAVLNGADINSIFDFKGFPEEMLKEEISRTLNTKKIPVELEKLLKEKAQGNMLFTLQLTEFLKDKGLYSK